jgi:type IV pilus assembly protein PilE
MRVDKTYQVQAFSLIELMIVVAITVTLTTIAIPGYSTYIKKSRRSDAINALLATQRTYELYYANNNSYPASNASLPSNDNYYTYSSITTTTSYTLTATAPAGSAQVSDTQGGIACKVLNINDINNKTPQDCWNSL